MTSKRHSDVQPVLASDLDGTLIPLPENEQNQLDLKQLKQALQEQGIAVAFVTGRHFELVTEAIEQSELPNPDWVICDVGTTIMRRDSGGAFQTLQPYADHQSRIIARLSLVELEQLLRPSEELRLQEGEKQGRFKLSYYADADRLDELVSQVRQRCDQHHAPYSIISSVDPFNGDGLIDLLPSGVSKAYALQWWCEHTGRDPQSIVFAGDSGNDLAAMTAGYRTIIVGNADSAVAAQAEAAHRAAGWTDRLFLAQQPATSGVLEGCRYWKLIS